MKKEFLGVEFEAKNLPALDGGFVPAEPFARAFLKGASKPLKLAVERENGLISVYDTALREGVEWQSANRAFAERTLKFLLWSRGGWRLYICGDRDVYGYIADAYRKGGAREFDVWFMSRVYERPFEVEYREYDDAPFSNESSIKIGGNTAGCRIGFDAGGSDRKVSAVIDGECVFSEEVVWNPKTQSDPSYHLEGIVSSFKAAAEHMPRIDAIGVSSAGVYINNRPMVASLFRGVPEELYDKHVKDIYAEAAKLVGGAPIKVINDGDVTALAGAMSSGNTAMLGIAMGTSEAAGYVDANGSITGWLNELAFATVDMNPDSARDEWSGDAGVGACWFSQDGVIRLAAAAGIALTENATPAELLSLMQQMLEIGPPKTEEVFTDIGCALAHTIAYYARFYDIEHALLLGRVMSGKGGDLIIEKTRSTLAEDYPELKISLDTPDEKMRRLGQSVAAASL